MFPVAAALAATQRSVHSSSTSTSSSSNRDSSNLFQISNFNSRGSHSFRSRS